MSNKKYNNAKKRRKVRNLNQAELEFAKKIVDENPNIGDASLATFMHEHNIATDINRKDLRNKVRYAFTNREKKINYSQDNVVMHTKEVETTVVNNDGTIIKHGNPEAPKKPKHKTSEDYLNDAGLNPFEFKVSSIRQQVEETEGDGDSGYMTRTTTKTSVSFSPRTRRDITPADFRDWKKIFSGGNDKELDAMLSNNEFDFSPLIKNVSGKYSLIIPLADLHIGEGNPVKTAKSFKGTFEKYIFPTIYERYFSNGATVDTIDIALLGDIVHCDNKIGTTAAGTAVANTGDVFRAIPVAANFLTWVIATTRETFKVPVRCIYVYGNHDTTAGFSVLSVVQSRFKGKDGISFMTNPALLPYDEEFDEELSMNTVPWYENPYRNPEYMWVRYGDVGVTFCHGKFSKKNAVNVPHLGNKNCRNQVSRNIVIYGHLHHREMCNTAADQDNFGLSTPNFCSDEYARAGGFYTDAEFYLFEINHRTNRPSYVPFPSLPYDLQD